MTTVESCPRCGRARVGYFRYCLGCSFDYDAAAPAAVPSRFPALVAERVEPAPTRIDAFGSVAVADMPDDEEAIARPRLVAATPAWHGAPSAGVRPAGADHRAVRSNAPSEIEPPDPRALRAWVAPFVEPLPSDGAATDRATDRTAAVRATGAAVLAIALVAVVLNLPFTQARVPAVVPPAGAIEFGSSFSAATFDLGGQSRALPAGTPVEIVASVPSDTAVVDMRLRVGSPNGGTLVDQPVRNGIFPSPWSVLDAGPTLFATTIVFPAPGTYRCELVTNDGRVVAAGSLEAL